MGNINEGDINEVRTADLQKEYRFQEANRKEKEAEVEYEKKLDNEFAKRERSRNED